MLKVCGAKFDPDAFLKRSKLKPYNVWHRGEPMFPRTRPHWKKFPVSGFNCKASRKGFDNLKGQITDAVRFLKKWRREILKLTRCPEVEEACLDFGIWKRDGLGQFDRFPPELVQSAGRAGIGIILSAYPASLPPDLKRRVASKSRTKPQKR